MYDRFESMTPEQLRAEAERSADSPLSEIVNFLAMTVGPVVTVVAGSWAAFLVLRRADVALDSSIVFIRSHTALLIPTEVLLLLLFIAISYGLHEFRRRFQFWFGVSEMALGCGTALSQLAEILQPQEGTVALSRKLAVLAAIYLMSRAATNIYEGNKKRKRERKQKRTSAG